MGQCVDKVVEGREFKDSKFQIQRLMAKERLNRQFATLTQGAKFAKDFLFIDPVRKIRINKDLRPSVIFNFY